MPRSSTLRVGTLSSVQPCVCQGQKKAGPVSDNGEAEDPGIQAARARCEPLAGHAQRLVRFRASRRDSVRSLVSVLRIFTHGSP